MLLVLTVLLIISGLTTVPFALEPLLTEKNWHIFLPWASLLYALGVFIAPVLFLLMLPFFTIKTGLIVLVATVGCIGVLLGKLTHGLLALSSGLKHYEGEATLRTTKDKLGLQGYFLIFTQNGVVKIPVSPILASRFGNTQSRSIRCTYLPHVNRIFKISIHE